MSVYHLSSYSDDELGKFAEDLKGAMKGFGTDEDVIIRILVNLNKEQRQAVKDLYKQKYGDDLIEDLKGELSGNFEDCILAMMMTDDEYAAKILNDAIQGAGTRESDLIGIMCTHYGDELEKIKELYKEVYGEDLESALIGETSSDLRRLMVSMVNNAREEGWDECERAREDAQKLKDACDGAGTNESVINDVLCSRSFDQLRTIFEIYKTLGEEGEEKDIEEELSSELSGHLLEGFLSIAKWVKDPIDYWVWRIEQATQGIGTTEEELVRIIVSRSEIDLAYIKQRFEEKHGKTVNEVIENECSGDYKKCLLGVLEGRIEDE